MILIQEVGFFRLNSSKYKKFANTGSLGYWSHAFRYRLQKLVKFWCCILLIWIVFCSPFLQFFTVFWDFHRILCSPIFLWFFAILLQFSPIFFKFHRVFGWNSFSTADFRNLNIKKKKNFIKNVVRKKSVNRFKWFFFVVSIFEKSFLCLLWWLFCANYFV